MQIYKFPNIYDAYRLEQALKNIPKGGVFEIKNIDDVPEKIKKEIYQNIVVDKLKKKRLFLPGDVKRFARQGFTLGAASTAKYQLDVSDKLDENKGYIYYYNDEAGLERALLAEKIKEFPPGTILNTSKKAGNEKVFNKRKVAFSEENLKKFMKGKQPIELARENDDNTVSDYVYKPSSKVLDKEYLKNLKKPVRIDKNELFGDLLGYVV